MLSARMPAASNRSRTWPSSPQVIGLTKPSGGGGVKAALILRICATKVGSPGIQLPMTIRPPGLVTRTISRAVSNGRGANIAPNRVTTKSKLRVGDPGEVAGVALLETQIVEAGGLGAGVAGGDQIFGDVDAEHVGAEPGGGQGRGAVAAAEVEDLHARRDAERGDQLLTAFAHGLGDPGEVALLPQRLVRIGLFDDEFGHVEFPLKALAPRAANCLRRGALHRCQPTRSEPFNLIGRLMLK